MPRYFFHQITHSGKIEDLEGATLDTLAEAMGEAIEDARGLMSDAIRRGHDISSRCLEICDDEGSVVAVLNFREAISKTE